MFVVLIRTPESRSPFWPPDELPLYRGWLHEDTWQPPVPWVPTGLAKFLGAPDLEELPYKPWLGEEGWQPQAPWQPPPVQGPLAWPEPDVFPTQPVQPALDEDGWQSPPPWAGAGTSRPLAGADDELPPPPALDEDGWQPFPPWPVAMAPSLLAWLDAEYLPRWDGDDGWTAPGPWVVPSMPRLAAWADTDELPPQPALDEDGWFLPIVWVGESWRSVAVPWLGGAGGDEWVAEPAVVFGLEEAHAWPGSLLPQSTAPLNTAWALGVAQDAGMDLPIAPAPDIPGPGLFRPNIRPRRR